MFGGELPIQTGADGTVFIDRDGPLFRYILNFLRSDELSLPKPFPELDALKIEADFYQITPLIRALRRHGWKDPIELNVGGVFYTASSETLTKYPDSFLGCLWRGVVEAEFDSEGRIFIDRDGQLFRHVVNFLRTDRLALPDDLKELESLEEEAVFYQIPALTKSLLHYRSESNRFVEIAERSDWNFIMVQAPDDILNHPNLPFAPSPYVGYNNEEELKEQSFYRDRGFTRCSVATKLVLCEFLRSIGCVYHDRSMAMTTTAVKGGTVTKVLEKWTAPRRGLE